MNVYQKLGNSLDIVNERGYDIAIPKINEMKLDKKPLILLTSIAMGDYIFNKVEETVGADCFISKPINEAFIYTKIVSMIKNKYDDIASKKNDISKLNEPKPTIEEIKKAWKEHVDRYIERFGQEKYDRLQNIKDIIKIMVKRIQSGEDEDTLVREYFEECNAIEPFPMD